MHSTATFVAEIVLACVNLFLYSICVPLLIRVYCSRERERTTQLVYLLNISIAEFIGNLSNLSYFSIQMSSYSQVVRNVYRAVYISCILIPYIASMFLITADRLAAAMLKLRYRIVCTLHRAKMAILCTWCVPPVMLLPLVVSTYLRHGYDKMEEVVVHIHSILLPLLFFVFFLFAVTTYLLIFIVYVRSRRRSTAAQLSVPQLFTRSRFSVALLLVSSFLLLTVVPELVYFTMSLKKFRMDFDILFFIIPNVSDTTDAFIYIIMYAPIRKLLISNLRRVLMWFESDDRRSSNSSIVGLCRCGHIVIGNVGRTNAFEEPNDQAVTAL